MHWLISTLDVLPSQQGLTSKGRDSVVMIWDMYTCSCDRLYFLKVGFNINSKLFGTSSDACGFAGSGFGQVIRKTVRDIQQPLLPSVRNSLPLLGEEMRQSPGGPGK